MMQPGRVLSSIIHATPPKPCNFERLWQMPSSWPTTQNSISSATATAPPIIGSILGTRRPAKRSGILTRSSTGIEPLRCFAAITRTATAFSPVSNARANESFKIDQSQIGVDTGVVPMPQAKPSYARSHIELGRAWSNYVRWGTRWPTTLQISILPPICCTACTTCLRMVRVTSNISPTVSRKS